MGDGKQTGWRGGGGVTQGGGWVRREGVYGSEAARMRASLQFQEIAISRPISARNIAKQCAELDANTIWPAYILSSIQWHVYQWKSRLYSAHLLGRCIMCLYEDVGVAVSH